MSTFLTSFADSEIKVRFKEPFLTGGLNEKHAVAVPRGIYRGFRLVPNATPNLITIEADADHSDHMMVYESLTGYSLSIRRTGGDFTLDLSGLLTSTTYILAVYAAFSSASSTVSEIRAYTLAEYNAAAEKDELVIMGNAVTPASFPGTVSERSQLRTLAYSSVPAGARKWVQIIEDGSFERYDSIGLDVTRSIPGWDTSGLETDPDYGVGIGSGFSPHSGYSELVHSVNPGNPVPVDSVLRSTNQIPVVPDRLVEVSFWLRGDSWVAPVTGAPAAQGMAFYFWTPDHTAMFLTQLVSDVTLTGTFGWTEVRRIFRVPTGAAWMQAALIVSGTNNLSGNLFVDDVSVLVETEENPYTLRQTLRGAIGRDSGMLTLQSIVDPSKSLDDIAEDAICTKHDGLLTIPDPVGRPDNDKNQVRMYKADGGQFRMMLEDAGLSIDQISSARRAAQPKVHVPFPDHSATAIKYTLIAEFENKGSNQGWIRVYAADSNLNSTDGLCITLNAWWEPDLSQWQRDVTSFRSSRFEFEREAFRFYIHEAGSFGWTDAGWKDNTDGFQYFSVDQAQAGEAFVDVLDALRITLNPSGSTETEVEAARVLLEVAALATNDYTNLIEAYSESGGLCRIRQYASIWGSGATSALSTTINARWDQSVVPFGGFYLDDNSEHASLLYQNEDGDFGIYAYDQAGGEPFDLFGFIPMFTIASDPTIPRAEMELKDGLITFTDESGAGTNRNDPGANNVLCASATVKAWAKFQVGNGLASLLGGFNVSSITYDALSPVVNFYQGMQTDGYAVVINHNGTLSYTASPDTLSLSSFTIDALLHSGLSTGPYHSQVNFSDPTVHVFTVIVCGRQT